MKFLLFLIGVLAALLLIGAVYVRLAPVDPARWHDIPPEADMEEMPGGALRMIRGGSATFEQLDEIIRATARTRVIAGSREEGMLTYETRSALFGFPDYTTVRHVDGLIEIYGRLKFGQSDLGVNARRIDGWLTLLGQGGG